MRWSKAAAQFRSPAFVRCLYDYLNEMDVKNVDWKSERRSCLTKSYYDMIILNTPNEPLYFEALYHKICARDFNWPYLPAAEVSKTLRLDNLDKLNIPVLLHNIYFFALGKRNFLISIDVALLQTYICIISLEKSNF